MGVQPILNHKIRKGGPRKKYVCKEGGGCQKNFLSSPPVLFFGIAPRQPFNSKQDLTKRPWMHPSYKICVL